MIVLMTAVLLLSGCTDKTRQQKELRDQALEFMEKGDWPAAISRIDDALELNTGSITDLELDCLKYRAEAEIRLDDYEAAAYTYGLIMEYSEEEPRLLYMTSYCLARAGKEPEKALEMYQKGEALDKTAPGRKEAFYAVMDLFSASEERSFQIMAQELLRKAGDDESLAEADIYNKLGNLYFDQKEYDIAIDYYDMGIKFIKTHPEIPTGEIEKTLTFNRAIAYEYKYDYKKALELLREYEEKFGSDEESRHEILFLDRY